MHITITARTMELTGALKGYVEEKLARMDRYLDQITAAHVILSIQKYRQIAEVTLHVRDLTIRAEESTADMYASIDLVVEKIERQILRYKERIVAHPGRGTMRAGGALALAEPAGGEVPEPFRVVRTKRFAMKPSAVDEAIMQMNLLGHAFYVFRNAGTGEVNVVYRRRDGDYGLIEPGA